MSTSVSSSALDGHGMKFGQEFLLEPSLPRDLSNAIRGEPACASGITMNTTTDVMEHLRWDDTFTTPHKNITMGRERDEHDEIVYRPPAQAYRRVAIGEVAPHERPSPCRARPATDDEAGAV